jgi:hypothetical protein
LRDKRNKESRTKTCYYDKGIGQISLCVNEFPLFPLLSMGFRNGQKSTGSTLERGGINPHENGEINPGIHL